MDIWIRLQYCVSVIILLSRTFQLYAQVIENNFDFNLTVNRSLQEADESEFCDKSVSDSLKFKKYFDGLSSIYYGSKSEGTCLPVHKSCGWPKIKSASSNLPMLVLSVGLEGAGHHLWTEILDNPVVDCLWINGRHYHRDIADGVPRTEVSKLHQGISEQYQLRKDSGKAACNRIYDAEDSFPTGAIRKTGRVFMRPDIINLQKLDGILYNIKYLIIARNVTDTALSALRRNFFGAIDSELRTVEHTLTYIEAALRGVPCHRIMIAHYEHALADPTAYIEPLSAFFELDEPAKNVLKTRLSKKGKLPYRKMHKLTQFQECKSQGLNEAVCYNKVLNILETFFLDRAFMWPTFAGNGFDFRKSDPI